MNLAAQNRLPRHHASAMLQQAHNGNINNAADGLLQIGSHEENCAECHHHHDHETKTNTKSISKGLHLKHDHQCTDHNCEIPVPHGHNVLKKAKTKNLIFNLQL